jgi:hypothetical protein
MVVVKSNLSAPNRRSQKVVDADTERAKRANTITPLSRGRERSMLSKVGNDGTLGATKPGGSLANKSQLEAIAVIPVAQVKPMWLRSLLGLQIASSIVTLLIVSVTLAVYGGTIYGQAKWSEEYQKLEKLRRYEQQLSVANELLKHEIAEQAASPDVGLVPQDSIEPIFLPPAPLRPAPENSSNSESDSKATFEIPLAY